MSCLQQREWCCKELWYLWQCECVMGKDAFAYCSGVILWKAQVTERVGMVLRDASAFCCRAACKTCKDGGAQVR